MLDDRKSLTRRQALKVIAGSATYRTVRGSAAAGAMRASSQTEPCQPKFFSRAQMATLDAVSETIIPADAHSPGARAARVAEYIDIVLAESKKPVQEFWRGALEAFDRMAERACAKKFAACTADEQVVLLESISKHEARPTTLEERFFVAVKALTIEGYYTSPIGIHQELNYQGNTALAEFPGCPHTAHKKP